MTLQRAVAEMTPRRIKYWLEHQNEKRTFTTDSCYDCLLAQYLAEKIHTTVDVGKTEAHHDGFILRGKMIYASSVSLPNWAVNFVEAFDSKSAIKKRVPSSCLRLLREFETGAA